MPTVLPGGQIIGGVGGRIYLTTNLEDVNDLPSSYKNFQSIDPLNPISTSYSFLNISQWSISRTLILAEVPHSGCVGGITRRVIGQTWRFSASMPMDQSAIYGGGPSGSSNIPDNLFGIGSLGIAGSGNTPVVGDVAIAFYLGDVHLNPEAVYMGMTTQRFYYSPRALIQQTNPVLNSVGDVIRVNITGVESCRLFLIPDEQSQCDRYLTYLNLHRGWL